MVKSLVVGIADYTFKIIYEKSLLCHNCSTALHWRNYLLGCVSYRFFSNVSLVHKILNNLFAPLLCDFISLWAEKIIKDSIIHFSHTAFGKSGFSFWASAQWNSLREDDIQWGPKVYDHFPIHLNLTHIYRHIRAIHTVPVHNQGSVTLLWAVANKWVIVFVG